MRVWDREGRLLVVPVEVNVSDAFDDRYIRKDVSTNVDAGILIDFADAGSNFRIKNGKAQIKADDGLWYYVNLPIILGEPDIQFPDSGE